MASPHILQILHISSYAIGIPSPPDPRVCDACLRQRPLGSFAEGAVFVDVSNAPQVAAPMKTSAASQQSISSLASCRIDWVANVAAEP